MEINDPRAEFEKWPVSGDEWIEGIKNWHIEDIAPRIENGQPFPRLQNGEVTPRFEHD